MLIKPGNLYKLRIRPVQRSAALCNAVHSIAAAARIGRQPERACSIAARIGCGYSGSQPVSSRNGGKKYVFSGSYSHHHQKWQHRAYKFVEIHGLPKSYMFIFMKTIRHYVFWQAFLTEKGTFCTTWNPVFSLKNRRRCVVDLCHVFMVDYDHHAMIPA